MDKGDKRDDKRDNKTAAAAGRKNAAVFLEGATINAKDHQGNKWWEAKVIEVDSEHSEVLVHFIGWNERHDEWIKMDSPRLQPAHRNSRRHSGTDPPAQKGPNPGAAAHIKEFKTGEEVMALWAKNTKYPAKIVRFEPDGSYLVEFYDGFKKHLRPQNIRRIQTEDLPFIAACKDDVKLFKAGRKGQEEPSPRRLSTESNNSSSSTATTTDLTTPPATTTATLVAAATEPRRERKSKFSVKDIFNFRKQGGNSSSADVVSTNTTTEVKSEDGAVATASFVESGSGVIKRRNSSLSRVGGSEVKEAAGGGELQRSDNGVGLVSLSSSTGDDGCLAATVVAATVASSSRHDVGRLQTRRRRGGKRSVSSDHRKRNDKQDEEEEDRNGNSPQGAVDPCVNCDSSPAKDDPMAAATPPVGPHGDNYGRQRSASGMAREQQQRRLQPAHSPPPESPAIAASNTTANGREEELLELLLLEDNNGSRDSLQSGLNSNETVDTGSEGTPSEKENLPACSVKQQLREEPGIVVMMSGAKLSNIRPRLSSTVVKENGVMPSPGGDGSARSKRSRKRKRFADEEPLVLEPATAAGGPESHRKSSVTTPATSSLASSKPARVIRATREVVPPGGFLSKLHPSPSSVVRRNSVLSPKKLPFQRSRNPLVSSVSTAASPLSNNASPVKKSGRSRPVGINSTAAISEKDSMAAAAPKIVSDGLKSPARNKAAAENSNLLAVTAPVIELGGPSNNNFDKTSILSGDGKRGVPSEAVAAGRPPIFCNGGTSTGGAVVGQLFPYLRFDFSLSPSELANNLVEGRNVPGPGQPILMESPKLPSGWIKKVTVRTNGVNIGKWDVLIENPAGQSFKSKQDLSRHFEANDLEFNIEDFDFMLDPILKRLRQIWKASQPSDRKQRQQQQPSDRQQQQLADCGGSSILGRGNSIPYELLGSTPPLPSSSSPSVKPEAVAALRLRGAAGGGGTPHRTPRPERSAAQQPPLLGINTTPASSLPGETGLSEGGGKSRGVRCPLKNCDKLFRSEYLLMMHVKHYHSPSYHHLVGNSPSVTDMAFHRTRLGESLDKEFETGGEILEALRKAEAREELKQQQQQSAGSSSSRHHRPPPPDQTTPARAAPPPPTKRKLSTGESMATASGVISGALHKRLKVSEEEHGELSISIPDVIAAVADLPVVKRNGGGATAAVVLLSPPLAGGSGGGGCVGVALTSTPITSTGGVGGGGLVARGRNRTSESLSLDVAQVTSCSRLRQDSMMSVGSESAAASTPPLSPAVPATPPQWRRRRMRTLPSEFTAAAAASLVPPEEPEEVMSEEELVVCLCGRGEGDGLMVQCDLCLTWQHGTCLNIFTEEQVPEKYICGSCSNPRLGRSSQLYSLDHDWIKEGQLLPPSPTSQQPQQLQQLGRLMTELSALSSMLHALQVKLSVAEKASHPKVFMWSAPWEEEEEEEVEQQQQQQDDTWPVHHQQEGQLLDQPTAISPLPFHHHPAHQEEFVDPSIDLANNTFRSRLAADGLTEADGGSSRAAPPEEGVSTPRIAAPAAVSCDDDTTVSGEKRQKPAGPEVERTGSDLLRPASAAERQDDALRLASEMSSTSVSGVEMSKQEAEYHQPPPHVPPPASDSAHPPPTSSSPMFNSSQLLQETAGDGGGPAAIDPFSFFDFPSLNEVKELLPSVLKDISCMADLAAAAHHHQQRAAVLIPPASPANVTLIPEPKLINREESRLNLIGHIEHLQGLVGQRLDLVEERLGSLEQLDSSSLAQLPDSSQIVQAVARLLTDIQSMKKVNSWLPDRI